MKTLKELTERLENQLRMLESECTRDLSEERIQNYYTSAKTLWLMGYDSRHHISVAYGLLKKINKTFNNSKGY